MTTRFSPIVRVRKLEVDKAQKNLSIIEGKFKELEKELAQLEFDIKSVAHPTSGTFALIRQNVHVVLMLKEEVEALNFAKQALTIQSNQAREMVRFAMLELEKIEHLHKEETIKIFSQRAQKEAKELDEMGIMLHALKENR